MIKNIINKFIKGKKQYGFFGTIFIAFKRFFIYLICHNFLAIKTRVFLITFISQIRVPHWLLKGVVNIDQAWDYRRESMAQIIKNNFNDPIEALEIGTWFGEGSTKLWLNQLQENSSLTLIDSWKAYATEDELINGPIATANMDKVQNAAHRNVLKFIEEMEEKVNVSIVKADGANFTKKFKKNIFDFIYIDASHYYEDVKRDLTEVIHVAKDDFSIICGDDLEIGVEESLLDLARDNITRDYIESDLGGFHPGVMLAVHEVFGKVNVTNGFWWVFIINGELKLDRPVNSIK